ncbi:glutamate--tRNA ligase [Hydrogenimonas sp.]
MLRFAPRPTGDMTVADLRVALCNYLAAKRRGERFVVRLEDGDRERNVEGKDREILDTLGLCGIAFDDVAYQSRNLTLHQHMAIKLLQERKAFACFCPEGDGEAPYAGGCDTLADAEVIDNPNPFVVRLKKPDAPVAFDDTLKGPLAFAPDAVDSFVILHTDKTPTYDFACAVDDMLLDISFIVRDEAHLASTPRQIAVREALGYDKAVGYAHLSVLEGGDVTVRSLFEEGFLPEAVVNHLLAVSMATPKPIFSLDEAAAWFDVAKLAKTPVRFDREALRAVNREQMRLADAKELSRAFGFADEAVGNLAKCFLDEGSTVGEIKPRIDAIFGPKPFGGPHGEAMRTLQHALKTAPLFEDFEDLAAYLAQSTGLRGDALETPLRLLLTGAEEGPELSALYPHLTSYLQEIVK